MDIFTPQRMILLALVGWLGSGLIEHWIAAIIVTIAAAIVFAFRSNYYGRDAAEQILAVLLRYGEMYGLQIIEKIEQDYGRAPGPGLVYPTLRQLEREGLVSTRWCEERLEKRGYKELIQICPAVDVMLFDT